MSEVLECPLHSGEFSADRGIVRNELHALTKPATDLLITSAVIDESIEISPTPLPYEDTPQLFPDAYQKMQTSTTFNAATGRFESYVTSQSSTHYKKPVLNTPFIPVGEYGVEPARRLLTATLRFLAIADAQTAEIEALATATPASKQLVTTHTFEGRIAEKPEEGFGTLMQLGIISTAQSIAQLTAERVPGVGWDELVANLVARDKIAEYARQMGLGLLPYLMIFGRYVMSPVTLQDGKSDLSQPLREVLRSSREDARKAANDALERLPILAAQIEKARKNNEMTTYEALLCEYRAAHATASGGSVCPAAGRGAEVTQTAQRLLQLMPAA